MHRSFIAIIKRRRWTIALLSVVVVFIIVKTQPIISSRHEIDINSGRVRHTRYVFGLQVSQHVESTWLSVTHGTPDSPADWKTVTTSYTDSRPSPHYVYHGAIGQTRTLEILDELVPFDAAAKKEVANNTLLAWQSGSYLSADDYIFCVEQIVVRLLRKEVDAVTVSDLPALE